MKLIFSGYTLLKCSMFDLANAYCDVIVMFFVVDTYVSTQYIAAVYVYENTRIRTNM